jgi:hypothetical protein
MRQRIQVGAPTIESLPFFVDLSKSSYERFTIKEDDVEVLITNHDGFRVVTGRGTKSAIDFMRDAMFLPTHSDELDSWIHEGFLKAGRIITHRLWHYIDIKMPVYLNGHSYGGAFMTVVAAFMVRFGLKPAGLVTQGCPRVGGRSLGKVLAHVPIRRMVMPGDVVPMVPFPPIFHHVGKPIRLPIPGPLLPGIEAHRLEHYEVGARYLAGDLIQRPA